MHRFAALFLLLTTCPPLSAQWFDWRSPTIPRQADGSPDTEAPAPMTPDGRPDLTGLWVAADAEGSLFDQSLIQDWAREAMAEAASNFYRDDPRFHCLPAGPSSYPAGPSVGGTRRIVQHPDLITVLNPDMTFREIFLDGRQLEEAPLLPTWMGYSVGRWEGDTLIVESNGYNDKTWLTREGLPHTSQLRITERYRRPDFGHIELQVRYEDPGTFTLPVEANITLENLADSQMLEVVCNESETGRRHYSGEITQAEEKVIEVPEEILEGYVGTYQGIWLGNLITAQVSLENGELLLTRTPRYSDTGGNTDSDTSRLIPQSENAFDCTCGLGFVFRVGADGVATEVAEVHVSGEWPFKRVE